MLAADAKRLPRGDGWGYEIKWDGVRAGAVIDRGLRLFSRRGEEISGRYPELAPLAGAVGGRKMVLDGEIVALDERGKPSFQLLQCRMGVTSPLTIRRRAAETPVTYICFDLLELDGRSTLGLPYERRRELLAELDLNGPNWQSPRHHTGDGAALLEAAHREGLEGVLAKRLDSVYRPGHRGREWIKVRLKLRQDFLIGGWMRGDGGRSGRIGSLLVGVWNLGPAEAGDQGESQRLVFAGGVGSGLSDRTIELLGELLEPLRIDRSPFEIGIGPKRPDPVFCEPRLVCSVEFSEWTREDTLRQPSFKGLRDDVDASEVVREAEADARSRSRAS